jgi:TusA-related sulfurtransferase
MTFVKTTLLLEKMQSGQQASIYLREGEALENLPTAILEKGGAVVSLQESPSGYHILTLQKI